ncbi:MAG: dephospho-CoA kinase [Pseudomonadota bacterium]
MTEKFTQFSVGLTGGIGSGKSAVATLLGELGASIIDTDAISHSLTAAGGDAMPAIATLFGNKYLTPDGALDRAAMRELVFSNQSARRQLESVLHPLIAQKTLAEANQARGLYLIFVVPLLVESGRWKDRVDRILVVDCSEDLQIQRVMRRNKMTAPQVQAIMATQVNRTQRLAAATDIVVNETSLEALRAEVEQLHQRYLGLANEKQSPPHWQKS